MNYQHIPKVFIILVNYNGTKDTVECIKSLNQIDDTSYEIIVVDNASNDVEQLEKELADFNFVKLLKSKNNLGFAGGNNVGIRYAMEHNADYVLLLNNDTVVEKDFLGELVYVAEKNPNAGIVTGKILFHSVPDHIWFAGGEMNLNRARTHHLESGKIDTKMGEVKEISFVTGCLMLISKKALETVGMLDDTYFMYSEDVDYCCRMRNSNFIMLYTSKSVIYHKISASTGGNGSPFSQYYRTRNDLRVISRYADKKVLAYVFFGLRLIKRNIVGQFQVKYTFDGLKAYLRGEDGRASKL